MNVSPGKTTCLLFAVFLFIHHCCAQPLPVATNLLKAYQQGTRDVNGAPGKNYWQNGAAYAIKVKFDPATRILTGKVAIDYRNESPDTLTRILFKLYPNLYQINAPRTITIAAADVTEGVNIATVAINETMTDPSAWKINGTNMNVRGVTVLPHTQIHFDIAYSYTLNKGSFVRTGQIDSGAFFIAYFFPRVAVYDDLDGWNNYPYTGQYEFYNDYGHFSTEITVPADYQVWATGDLTNADEVYQPQIVSLINRATTSNNVVDIITPTDVIQATVTKPGATNTWKFDAVGVTDMAFAISNHYVWQSTSIVVDSITKRRTRVDAVFNPSHSGYHPVINYVRKTVELISYYFPKIAYPYAHETSFDGPDEMEFPMMLDNGIFKNKKDAVELTAHEVFHSLFPFYVGVNETKYSFMDEGWATMAEFYLHPLIDSASMVDYDISDVNNSAGTEQDMPIVTLTPQLAGAARFANKDLKPALGYFYVKEMLGEERFLKGLHYYIAQWHGRHPSPYDFFYCMNKGAGVNLNWFWKNWFFEKGIPDLAIDSVSHLQQHYSVAVINRGTEFVPVHLTVYYSDGSKQMIGRSIACWVNGNKSTVIKFDAIKRVEKIVLGTALDADANAANNLWVNTGK